MSAVAEFEDAFQSTGATAKLAPGPIGGPGAWRGADMAQRSGEWIYQLSEAEVTELDDAMRRTRDRDIIGITRDDFALPTLGGALDNLRSELLTGRGFTVIRGVPVEEYSLEEAARIYWGIGAYLGRARSQNAKGHVLGHVCDLGARYDAFKYPGKARIYQTRVRQRFHTDSTDIVGLMCLQKAKAGGESSISSSVTVHDEMWRRDRRLWAEMYKPLWRDRRGEIPAGKLAYYPCAAFHYHEGLLSTIYARDYIESCDRFEELPKLTENQIAALDLFDKLSEDLEIRLDMAFEPGDIQFLHNHQILHARADFEDWPEVERKRHLLRLWLSPEDARPLPDSFLERYLGLEIGNRGGIIAPGAELNVPLVPE
ncbi:MAG: TauD/TfdA family dioxygenase [Alphaproteobacteria bacterium]|nr:TauD/TfdA family dioxygenase [Alphaproteobacteria bacterium]